jgi:hypothetical protein
MVWALADGGLILIQHKKTIGKMIAHLQCKVLLSVDMASSSFDGSLKRLNAPASLIARMCPLPLDLSDNLIS